MSNTIIQIKRSQTTLVPTDLQPGELAYSGNSEVLFIGSVYGSNVANVVAIAGVRNPGILSANQALVTNVNNFINEIKVNKITIDTDGGVANITAISTDSSISGSNNSGTVLLSANAIKQYVVDYVSTSGFYGIITSDNTNSNTLLSNSTSQDTLTIQGTTNEVSVALSGDTFTVGLPDSVTITNALTVNTANVTDTTASSNTTTGALTVAGGLGVAGRINTAEAAVGNTSVYTSVNGTVVSTGSVLATNTVNASVLSVGGWVIANNSGLFTSGVVNTNVLKVSNATAVLLEANDTSIAIANGITLSVNGSVGVANQVLASNGTGLYWRTVDADIEEVVAGDGLNGGGISGQVTIDVGAGDGIAVNASSVSVLANNGIVANSTGVFVNPGTGLTVNSTGVHIGQDVSNTAAVTFGSLIVTGNLSIGVVNTNIMPLANVTYNIGNNTMRWAEIHAQNVHSVTGKFDGNVEIAGDLTVSGNVVTVNVSTLSVTDPLIQLASNNTTSDIIDIGFFGSYETGSGPHEHAGLFRDATDGIFKLFKDLTESPAVTVNTAGAGYATATLEAYLNSGALTTNSTSVIITANSTVNVALVANTLSLGSALLGNSGGTGLSSYTAEDILVANSTNGFRKLALGSVGTVLQSNGTALLYAGLDGGTF